MEWSDIIRQEFNEDSMKKKIKSILGDMNIFLGSLEAQRRKDGLIIEIDKL